MPDPTESVADQMPAEWLEHDQDGDTLPPGFMESLRLAEEAVAVAEGVLTSGGPALTPREQATYDLLLVESFDRLLRLAREKARAAAAEAFTSVGQREVAKLNGVDLGNVRLDPSRGGWKVTNPTAFQAWVTETSPEEIVSETTYSVANSYRTYVLAALKRGEAITVDVIDPVSGEVETRTVTKVPGVTFEPDTSKVVATPTKEAPYAILDVLGGMAAQLGVDVDRKALEA
jgi:hypothetical protein